MKTRLVCTAAVGAAAWLALAAHATAATVTDRPLLFSFDGSDTTAGPFRDQRRLEVEQSTGDVYVVDNQRRVLDKFNAAGVAQNFAATGKSSVNLPYNSVGSLDGGDVAIDNSGVNPGRIYAVTGQGGSLLAFEPAGNLLWEIPFTNLFAWCAAAVDSAGHLWVIDRFSDQVREYASSGSPPVQIGSFPYVNGGAFPCSLDFDSTGNAYIATEGAGQGVYKYAGGAYSPPPLDPEGSNGVAVDRTSGHVFTSHRGYFNEYDASGTLIGRFGEGVLSSGQGIAYSHYDPPGPEGPLDRVYVANFSGHEVYAFGPIATGTVPDVSIEAADEIEVSRARLNGKVKPNSVPNAYFFEWKKDTEAGAWGEAKSSPPQSLPEDNGEYPVSFDVNHLAGNTTYQARLVGVNTANGLRQVSAPIEFTTKEAEGPPEVTIDPPAEVGTTSAKITGTVNPREDFGTTWWLETSTDPECESGFSSRPVHQLESEANAPVPVSEELTGLLPSEAYCVRIAAENSAGGSESETEEFTTDPIAPTQVTTAFAAPRTDTSARLNGFANPEGEVLTYRFKVSEDGGATWTSLPDETDTSEARTPVILAAELTGLEPATTYSYRFSAENPANAGSPLLGAVKTFTTRSVAEIAEVDPPPGSCPNEKVRTNQGYAYLAQCRGIELVNQPDNGNQNVKAEVGQVTPPLSADGERAIWNVNGGAPGGNSGLGATFLAKRTGPTDAAPSGWLSRGLVPPAAQQLHAEDGSYALNATTPDLRRFIFIPGDESTGLYKDTLVRLDENQNQEVLKRYDGLLFDPWPALSEDGARVLNVDRGSGELEDIGTPGKAEVVSYLPDGSLPECGVEFDGSGFNGSDTVQGAGGQWRPGYQRIAASDASRVYFQVHPDSTYPSCNGPWQIFERNREANGGAGQTLEVAPPDPYNAMIRATPDGRSLFFVTAGSCRKPRQVSPYGCEAEETADTNEHVDVYRWEEAPDGLSGTNTCLTCDIENEASEPIDDANLSIDNGSPTAAMVSDDLSHIYFESSSKLTPQATEGRGNLYALSGGEVRFVATPNAAKSLAFLTAELSSDGNVLVFRTGEEATANRRLTADRLAASCVGADGSAGPCQQLYRYDDRDRSLECVSCLHGGITGRSIGTRGATPNHYFHISANGETVAFVTAQALVPRDFNGGLDLYEWRSGAQRLISDGRGDFQQDGFAALEVFAVSADGRDILFRVIDPGLTGFEQGSFSNLYDARSGGGFEPPSPALHCDGDSCQGPLQAAPPRASRNSETYIGPPNLRPARKPCRKGRVRRQGRCVVRHERHKGKKHKHRAKHHRKGTVHP